jgi:PAS domain S-box-containing protein
MAIDGTSPQWTSPFIIGIAAVIASAAWAGPGPGILCTVFVVIWCGLVLREHNISWANTIIRCSGFVAESLVLCLGSSRMLRSAREAEGSEAWHRQLVETAAEGIWIRDSGGTITYANARIAEILGTTVQDISGRKAEEFFFPADLSVEHIRAETLTAGIKEQFDRRLRRVDGAEVWVLACCNSIGGKDGEAPSMLAMMTDITERKQAEYALRRSEERFRSLFEGVLEGVYQSTPEGNVLAANPMLLKMLGFANEAELNDIHIARDLYVDPGSRKRLMEQLERDGSFQNVEYELRARDGRIVSVLENARVVRGEKGEVLYYEGTLIDITSRKRIEEQLRQAQKVEALGRLAGGIARDFNSILNVVTGHMQSALRELPASHSSRPAVEQALQAAGSATALTAQLISFSRRPTDVETTGSGSILLVGDEPLVRELSRDMLERQGFVVTSASSGDEAVRLGGKGARFDLMITDTSMPDMTGVELARQMRSAQPGLRVLFISGYTDPPLNREDLSSEASEYLAKPFSADSLGRKIGQMLQDV